MPQNSAFIAFIQSIISFRGDLCAVTAPTFLLLPHSYLEYVGLWAEQPSLFVAPAKEPDAAKRALLVMKWFLTTIRPRLYGKNEKPLGKKPLNPFLGELNLGHWEDEECGRTEMVAEQVGHHPPCTAICVSNAKFGVKLQGYVGIRSHFSGSSIVIDNNGHMSLHIDKYDEDYVFTLCPGVIKGLFAGSPYPDLAGEIRMYSSSGFKGQVQFSGKGWLSSKKNSVKATIHSHRGNEALYSVEGSWLDELTIRYLQLDNVIERHKIRVSSQLPLTEAAIEDQDPWEIHKAWHPTATAIISGNASAASNAKSKIEVGQRQMRVKEREEGRTWKSRFFSTVPPSSFLALLVEQGKLNLADENTGGIWRYDEAKAKDATVPYHPGLTPDGPA